MMEPESSPAVHDRKTKVCSLFNHKAVRYRIICEDSRQNHARGMDNCLCNTVYRLICGSSAIEKVWV